MTTAQANRYPNVHAHPATRPKAEVDRPRQHALEKANRIRRKCRRLRERIAELPPSDGAALVAKVLLDPPEFTASLKIARLLRAIHGFGAVRAQKIAGPRARTSIGELSYRERVRIAAECVRRSESLSRRKPTPAPQRAASERALLGANQVRIARAQELGEIALARDPVQGAFRAGKLIISTTRPEPLDGLTVLAVLEAVPRMGDRAARKFMARLNVGDRTELWMLSRSRAVALATALIALHSPTAELEPADHTPSSATRMPPGTRSQHERQRAPATSMKGAPCNNQQPSPAGHAANRNRARPSRPDWGVCE
jgi:hypothetical protein